MKLVIIHWPDHYSNPQCGREHMETTRSSSPLPFTLHRGVRRRSRVHLKLRHIIFPAFLDTFQSGRMLPRNLRRGTGVNRFPPSGDSASCIVATPLGSPAEEKKTSAGIVAYRGLNYDNW
ncbi:hypothetical protein EYF80_001385 [Liparis tanakae]|uniref:Uncharacterized protein n=1 Tax=Liparis tanakae TaxID=230148 RepID=A0A4Z2JH74_9TELE|nr:hypothetical protein EYF80_001385 [Liparis tanakae]